MHTLPWGKPFTGNSSNHTLMKFWTTSFLSVSHITQPINTCWIFSPSIISHEQSFRHLIINRERENTRLKWFLYGGFIHKLIKWERFNESLSACTPEEQTHQSGIQQYVEHRDFSYDCYVLYLNCNPGIVAQKGNRSWLKAWSRACEKDGRGQLWSLLLWWTSVVLVVSKFLKERSITEKASVGTVLCCPELFLVGCMCWKCRTNICKDSHSERAQRLRWGLPKRSLPACWFTEPTLIKIGSELNESWFELMQYFHW